MRGARGVRGVALAIQQGLELGQGAPLQPSSCSIATLVQERGVARSIGVLSHATSAQLRRFVLEHLKNCMALPSTHGNFAPGIYQMRASARAPRTRWDLCLPLSELAVWEAVREAMFGAFGLGCTFQALLGSCDAELWEVSAAITAPGAVPQQLHVDTDWTVEPCLFTSFIALQTVERCMGPTSFVLDTHKEDAQLLLNPATLKAHKHKSVVALLDAGDATIYDSRLLHAGGANSSSQWRALLTLTFRHPSASKSTDREDSRSMLPTLGRLGLRMSDLNASEPPSNVRSACGTIASV